MSVQQVFWELEKNNISLQRTAQAIVKPTINWRYFFGLNWGRWYNSGVKQKCKHIKNQGVDRMELEEKAQVFLGELEKKMIISNALMKPCNRMGCVSGHFDTEEGLVGFMLLKNVSFVFFGNKISKAEQEIIKAAMRDWDNLKAYGFGEERLPLEGDWSWKRVTEMAEGNLMLQGLLALFAPGNK